MTNVRVGLNIRIIRSALVLGASRGSRYLARRFHFRPSSTFGFQAILNGT